MKKLLVFFVLLACGDFVFAQDIGTLDQAIKDTATAFIESRLDDDMVLGVLAVESSNKDLSVYISEHLAAELTGKRFIVVSRDEQIQKLRDIEFDNQENGNVSEETKTEAGEALGLDIIITGKIALVNNVYEMKFDGTAFGSTRSLVTKITRIRKTDKTLVGFLRDDSWKTRRVYIGVRGGLAEQIFDLSRTAGIYSKGEVEENPNTSFNVAGEFAFQFNNWASLQIEGIFTTSKMQWQYKDASQNVDDWQIVNATNILAPILFKPTFYIEKLYLSPFVGGYLNMSWGNYEFFENGSDIKGTGDVVFDVIGGAVFGGDIGIKAGPGIVFLDLRYLIDVGRTRPNTITGGSMIYGQKKGNTIFEQQMLMASVGYRIGFGGKK